MKETKQNKKRSVRWLINVLLIAIGILSSMSICVDTAKAENTCGSCGKNVSWRIMGNSLFISGIGNMTNFYYDIEDETALTPWSDFNDNIENIYIGEGVTSIGKYAFYGCENLVYVEIPNSVTSIGRGAFFNCISLENIDIPESVISIGKKAFYNCESLTQISLPSRIKIIEDEVFAGCVYLESIDLPNGLKSIGEYAFYNCLELKNIIIPNSVIIINENAFCACISLEEIDIPANVKCIQYVAFSECIGVTSVKINGKTFIGENAFFDIGSVVGKRAKLTLPQTWNINDLPSELSGEWRGGFFDCNLVKPKSHTHTWEYMSNGNVLEAYCANTTDEVGCEYSLENKLSLTLVAKSADYSGDSNIVSVGTDAEKMAWEEAFGQDFLPQVRYYNEENNELLEGAPVNVGKYIAKISPVDAEITDNKEACVKFEIRKVNPVVTSPQANDNLVYNGKEQELVSKGNTTDGTIVYSLTENGEYSEVVPSKKEEGTYTVYVKVIGDANHNDLVLDPIKVTITKKVNVSLSVSGYNSSLPIYIYKNFTITNNEKESLDLSKVTLKYYFTKDSRSSQSVAVDYAGMNLRTAPWYVFATNYVNCKIVNYSGNQCYMEISFKKGIAPIPQGESMEIQTRFANNDWSIQNQANDYSNKGAQNVVITYNNDIIWGKEPENNNSSVNIF